MVVRLQRAKCGSGKEAEGCLWSVWGGVGGCGVGVGCLAESKNAAVLVLWYNQKTDRVS